MVIQMEQKMHAHALVTGTRCGGGNGNYQKDLPWKSWRRDLAPWSISREHTVPAGVFSKVGK